MGWVAGRGQSWTRVGCREPARWFAGYEVRGTRYEVRGGWRRDEVRAAREGWGRGLNGRADRHAFRASLAMLRTEIQSYRDLRVWQRGMELAEVCFRLAQTLPVDQRFGLASQIQRAAVSIPANIAEGHCRRHRADYARHLSVARGSLGELETHLLLTERLGLLTHSTLVPALSLADQLGRMLFTLHLRLTTKARPLPSPLQTPRTSHPAPRT